MRNIEWNKVTWYSKLLAIIIFVGVFFLGFYLGMAYDQVYSVPRFDMRHHADGQWMSSSTAPNTTSSNSNQTVINSVVFSCSQNKTISAQFMQSSVALTLSDGRSMTLPQTISADGARYANADESFIFWNKGNTAFVAEGATSTYQNCVVTSQTMKQ